MPNARGCLDARPRCRAVRGNEGEPASFLASTSCPLSTMLDTLTGKRSPRAPCEGTPMPHPIGSAPRRRLARLGSLGLPAALLAALGPLAPPARAKDKPVEARRGLVVSVSAPGSEVGLAILKKGGNAVDASVATAFALAVNYPGAGNLGGGGFMLVHPAGPGAKPVVIEYRETAPAAATKTMFARD